MDVTEKEAFKLGFLHRCAEEALVGEALEQRVNAAEAFAKSGFDMSALSGAGSLAGNIAYAPLLLATAGGDSGSRSGG